MAPDGGEKGLGIHSHNSITRWELVDDPHFIKELA